MRRKKCKRDVRKIMCGICGKKAHGDCGYCLDHLPKELRCTCMTAKGKRCRLPIVKDLTICKVHLTTMKRGKGTGKSGWVYVYDTAFKKDGKGIYKIGRSLKPDSRAHELEAGNPYGKMLFAGFVGNQARTIEGSLHSRYSTSWLGRELFALTDQEIASLYIELWEMATDWYEHEEGKKAKFQSPLIPKATGVIFGGVK